MTMPTFTYYLRDPQFGRVERLDMWTSFNIIPRFNKVGTWELEVPKRSNIAGFVTERTGIIVQRNGETIFSGPAGYTPESYIETKNSIKLAGVDDNIFLNTPARPTPSLAEGPYPDAYDVTTGVASTIMRSLVNRNIGPSAPAAWKIPELALAADPLLGSVITARARFDPLIILLAELASTPIATGLGFRLIQSDTLINQLIFQIYAPADKHLDTVFSVELKTALDYERIHQTPSANYFIVAGGDNFGINRTIVEGGDTDSINAVGRRIAQFVDKRGVTDTSELQQELAELIAGTITSDIITIEPIDTPDLTFGEDYDLGDYVNCVVEGVEYPRIIREVEIEFSNDRGPIIKPVLADPNGTKDDVLTNHFYSLEGRLSNIERNWTVPNDSIINDMMHPHLETLVGDIKMTGRSAAQQGWHLCDGTAISRTVYSSLFTAIGTTYGAGNGSTTFNVPDLRDRFPMGKGTSHALGTSGGSFTPTLNFTTTHSHSLSNHTHASQAHTHPGSHSHGIGSHTHSYSHTHNTNIAHNHATELSGFETNFASDALGRTAGSSTGTGHKHNVDLSDTGTLQVGTNFQSSSTTGEGSGNTEPDSNAHAALYSGSASVPVPNVTADDSTGISSSANTIKPPYQVVNFEIYLGVG